MAVARGLFFRWVFAAGLLGILIPSPAHAGCPEFLSRIWQGAAERTQRFYSRQWKPIAEDATAYQKSVAWMKRAGSLAFNVALAPPLLAVDVLGSAAEIVSRPPSWENGRLNALERTAASLLSIIPTSLPHLTLYAALTASGINLPMAIEEATPSTYLSDFQEVVGQQLSLHPNEMIVFLAPAPGTDVVFDHWIEQTQAAFDAQLPPGVPSPLRIIRENNSQTALAKLAELRNEGQIEQMVIAAHGSPGRVNLEARSLNDEVFRNIPGRQSNGLINAEQIRSANIPPDLFTADARLIIAGCSAARGEKGEQLLQACHAHLMHGNGIVAGSSTLLRLTARTESQSLEDLRRQVITRPNLLSGDQLQYYVQYHFWEAPIRMAAYDFFGLGTLYRNYAEPEQPPIVTYPPALVPGEHF